MLRKVGVGLEGFRMGSVQSVCECRLGEVSQLGQEAGRRHDREMGIT